MGWVSAAATAVSAVTSVAAARQASATGQYNKDIQERNAIVGKQEAEAIRQKTIYDIAQFDRKFAALQGQTKTAVLKSGAELSGSGLRILRANAREAEIEKDMIEYNSKIGQARAFEQANFARMQGEIAKQQARSAEFGYYSQAGMSLLRGFGD